jgi:hypothetical protein
MPTKANKRTSGGSGEGRPYSLSWQGPSDMLSEEYPVGLFLRDLPENLPPAYATMMEPAKEAALRLPSWFVDRPVEVRENVRSMFEALQVVLQETERSLRRVPSRELEWVKRAVGVTRAIRDDLSSYGVQDVQFLYDIEDTLLGREKELERSKNAPYR